MDKEKFIEYLLYKKARLESNAEELIQERDNPEEAEKYFAKAELIDEILNEMKAADMIIEAIDKAREHTL